MVPIHLTGMSLPFSPQSTPSPTPCASPTISMPTLHSQEPRAPLQVRSIGSVADVDAPTGYEPSPFAEMSTIGPSQSFFHGLRVTSKYSFAESFTLLPLDLDINDEQRTEFLASLLFPQERESSDDRSQVCHSQRENLVSDSSRLQTRTERSVALRDSESEKHFRFLKNRDNSISQKRTLNYWSKIVELRKLMQLFVNFNDR